MELISSQLLLPTLWNTVDPITVRDTICFHVLNEKDMCLLSITMYFSACDDIGAMCDDNSSCINPSEGPLAGCCVPKGMTLVMKGSTVDSYFHYRRDDLEGGFVKFEPQIGEFGLEINCVEKEEEECISVLSMELI